MGSLLFAVALLLMAGCGPFCGGASTSGPAQPLVFTGPVAGTLTAAHVDCRVYAGAGQFNAAITGTFDARPLTFNVQIHSNYKGAGTYSVGSLLDGAGELRLQVADFVASTASGPGTLTIADGGASGAMGAELSTGEHVKGTFRCDEVHTA